MFIDCWFMFEIVVNFFTGFYKRGKIVMSKKKIAQEYIKSWFLLDLLSSIPFSFFSLASSADAEKISLLQQTKIVRVLRLVKYARLLRLLRFMKVNKLMQTIEDAVVGEIANIILKFIKLSLALIFITHWNACAFFLVGSL